MRGVRGQNQGWFLISVYHSHSLYIIHTTPPSFRPGGVDGHLEPRTSSRPRGGRGPGPTFNRPTRGHPQRGGGRGALQDPGTHPPGPPAPRGRAGGHGAHPGNLEQECLSIPPERWGRGRSGGHPRTSRSGAGRSRGILHCSHVTGGTRALCSGHRKLISRNIAIIPAIKSNTYCTNRSNRLIPTHAPIAI